MPWWPVSTEDRGDFAFESDSMSNVERGMFSSVTHRPFPTEAECLAYIGPGDRCKECGHLISSHFMHSKQLLEKQLCFTCHFWATLVGKGGVVVNGKHHQIGSKQVPNTYNGCGGRWFKIRMADGRVIDTCDLWVQGMIPNHFRGRLPDNAEFLPWP